MEQFSNPKSIYELSKFPNDMLNHFGHIAWLDSTLQSFIRNHVGKNKGGTISLDDVIIALEKYKCNLDAEDVESNQYAKDVEKCLIKTKFGSVAYDW